MKSIDFDIGGINRPRELKTNKPISELIRAIVVGDKKSISVAIESISKFDTKRVIQEIIAMLNNKSHFEYPLIGVIATGRLGLKELIPEIIKQLENENFMVRESAIMSLDELDAKEAIPEMIKHIKDIAISDLVCKTLKKWGVKIP